MFEVLHPKIPELTIHGLGPRQSTLSWLLLLTTSCNMLLTSIKDTVSHLLSAAGRVELGLQMYR